MRKGGIEWGREREGEVGRRETDRQTETQRQTDRDRETDRGTD